MKKNYLLLIPLFIVLFSLMSLLAEEAEVSINEEETLFSSGIEDRIISMDFKDTELSNVLRIIAQTYELNIIAGPDVSGLVTVSFTNVTLEDALTAILNVNGYDFIIEGNIIRIIPLPLKQKVTTRLFTLQKANAEAIREAVASLLSEYGKVQVVQRSKNEVPSILMVTDIPSNMETLEEIIYDMDVIASAQQLTTKVYKLKHIEASALEEPLKKVIGEEGEVKVFIRKDEKVSDTLIVTDTPSNFLRIDEVIEQLDRKIPQVMIVSRIVEVSTQDVKNLGLEWIFTDHLTGSDIKKVGFGLDREDYIRLFEEGTFAGEEEKLPVLLDVGWAFANWIIDEDEYALIIQALETKTDANTLSNPRIVAQSNKEAEIFVGESVPVPTYSYSSDTGQWEVTGVEEKEIGITLKVTPTVHEEDKTVEFLIQPEVSGPFTYVQEAGGRTIGVQTPTRKAQTVVTVPDSKTIVIGGLIANRSTLTTRKVPLLGDIPILGNLFKSTSPDERKTELLIFVTPYILTEEKALIMAERLERGIYKKATFFLDDMIEEGKKLLKYGELDKAEEKFKEALDIAPIERKREIEILIRRVIRAKVKKAKEFYREKTEESPEEETNLNKGYLYQESTQQDDR